MIDKLNKRIETILQYLISTLRSVSLSPTLKSDRSVKTQPT